MATTTTAKPGWKSSEFGLTLFANLLAAFMASGILPDASPTMKIAAFVASTLANIGYTAGRSYLKK